MRKNKDLFQVPAQITKLETMNDGGIRIVLDTQEITDPEELMKLFKIRKGSVGWFLFKETEIVDEDVPDEAVSLDEGETKTPSQRYRAVLFVFWKQIKGGVGNFNDFYRSTMEKLIENVKSKLPPQDDI